MRNLAVLEERHRLGQELHDNIAQAVGYLSLQLSITSELLANNQTNEARVKLRELRQIVNEIYTDVREEIFNLRSQISPETSFLEALSRYVAKYKRYYDLNVQISIETDEAYFELPMEVGVQLIRIIQEALINVRKHSGVNQACIRFKEVGGSLCLSVEDQGHGFDPAKVKKTSQSGFGLQIMAERAESIGGKLELETTLNRGVRVAVWLPAHFES